MTGTSTPQHSKAKPSGPRRSGTEQAATRRATNYKRKTSLKSRFDATYMKELGRRGGLKTVKKRGKKFFSEIAKLSHRNRTSYNGGRPKGSVKTPPVQQ